MKFKTVKEEIMRIRAGYTPKTDSFWLWSFYTVNGIISLITLRIRMALE